MSNPCPDAVVPWSTLYSLRRGLLFLPSLRRQSLSKSRNCSRLSARHPAAGTSGWWAEREFQPATVTSFSCPPLCLLFILLRLLLSPLLHLFRGYFLPPSHFFPSPSPPSTTLPPFHTSPSSSDHLLRLLLLTFLPPPLPLTPITSVATPFPNSTSSFPLPHGQVWT